MHGFRNWGGGATLMLAALGAQGATLDYLGYEGLLAYDGSNHGFPANLPLADRSVTTTGFAGAIDLDQDEVFSNDLGAGRMVTGATSGAIRGMLDPSGFSFALTVSASTSCTDPGGAGCPRSLSQDSELEFGFQVDSDATLFFAGDWAGGDGSGVSLVDFFRVELVRLTGNPFNPEELLVVTTNLNGFTDSSGSVNTSFGLEAGETYVLMVRNRTNTVDGADSGFADFRAAFTPVPVPAAGLLLGVPLVPLLRARRAGGRRSSDQAVPR